MPDDASRGALPLRGEVADDGGEEQLREGGPEAAHGQAQPQEAVGAPQLARGPRTAARAAREGRGASRRRCFLGTLVTVGEQS